MPGRWAYNLLYRVGAARLERGWDKGAGPELVDLVSSGRITSGTGPGRGRALDLGCGTGGNVMFLAEQGWDAVGVDFSSVAISKARREAAARGMVDGATFLVGDVTAPELAGVEGVFDLVVVYNTLQDLLGDQRSALASLVRRHTAPGSQFLLWCYQQPVSELPAFSFNGPSRRFPFVVEPGEENSLFGEDFTIERLLSPPPETRKACFLMTRA
jgi:SAM-dependent methyltransferase